MELVKFEDYSFTYQGGDEEALAHINLGLEEGQFALLYGKSGCGKSTLLRQLKSVLTPNGIKSGKILFRGTELQHTDLRTQSTEIGFVMQNPDSQIVMEQVWQELAFGLESLGISGEEIRIRVAEMASYFGIQHWFHKSVEELSGGQKQLLNLASVMVMKPFLLILDEPTAQLDPIAAEEFLETVRKINQDIGTTVLMTEHRVQEVFSMADTVILMEQGKICINGTPKDVVGELYQQMNPLFKGMPATAQIYAEVTHGKDFSECPLTVREGRSWIKNYSPADHRYEKNGHKERRIEHPIIEMKDVWFRYERELPDVIRGLSVKINRGELYCIMGGNGTGKSTMLSLLSRIRSPYRGKIQIEGKDIRKYTAKELYQGCLGVVPQNPQSLFVKKTVELELCEMIEEEKKELIKQAAELLHLEALLERHPFDLSGGEQQRLALAKILLLNPRILLLDEPTKGMDAQFKQEFAAIISRLKKRGITIIMVSHDIEFCAEYADCCGMFFDGGIVAEHIPEVFFSGNNFYTTMANKMCRGICRNAVLVKDVVKEMKEGESGIG